ncbi:MAG: N-acetyltransferase [Thermodesulfobacteriota bacterium]
MVRKALLKDVKDIFDMVEFYARKGEMLHRPLNEIYSYLRDFYVFESSGAVVGVAALHICWEDLAEIRTLAVKENASGRGIGTSLVNACIDEARMFGVKRIFALTYKPAFFEKLGFKSVDKDILPQKIWGDCIRCVKFPNCDENAVLKEL